LRIAVNPYSRLTGHPIERKKIHVFFSRLSVAENQIEMPPNQEIPVRFVIAASTLILVRFRNSGRTDYFG
jgi:hypothetical protein